VKKELKKMKLSKRTDKKELSMEAYNCPCSCPSCGTCRGDEIQWFHTDMGQWGPNFANVARAPAQQCW